MQNSNKRKDIYKTIIKTSLATVIFCGVFLILRYSKLSRTLNLLIIGIFALIILFVLSVGFFSLVVILVSIFRKKTPKKNNIAWVTSMFIFVIFLMLLILIPLPIPSQPLPSGSDLSVFDSEDWKLESSIEYNNGISEREKMLEDLVENILPGKSKNEIIQLLGQPLDTPYFKNIEKDMIYYLGPERGGFLNIDSEWLLIWLNEQGYFKKYQIVND